MAAHDQRCHVERADYTPFEDATAILVTFDGVSVHLADGQGWSAIPFAESTSRTYALKKLVGAAADMTAPAGLNVSLEISSVEVKLNRQFDLTALRRHRAAPAAQYPQVVEVPGARPVIRYSSVFDRWLRETDGQDLIEYLLVGTLIAVAVVAGAMSLGDSLNQWYGAVADPRGGVGQEVELQRHRNGGVERPVRITSGARLRSRLAGRRVATIARADFSRNGKPIQKPDGRTAGIVARGLTAFADSGRRDNEPVLTCRPFSGLRNIASRDAIRSDSTILGRITSLLHT